MSPIALLLGMYAGFAALLFASGYIYKSIRDRKNNRINPTFNFEPKVEEPVRHEKPVAMTRGV